MATTWGLRLVDSVRHGTLLAQPPSRVGYYTFPFASGGEGAKPISHLPVPPRRGGGVQLAREAIATNVLRCKDRGSLKGRRRDQKKREKKKKKDLWSPRAHSVYVPCP